MKKNNIGIFFIIIFISLTVFLFYIFNRQKNNIPTTSPAGIIFAKENTFFFIPDDKPELRWTPVSRDVEKAESVLKFCAQKDYPNVYEKLDQYKRQYVGIYNEGRKNLLINAFIDRKNKFTEWENFEVLVKDGGDDFFEVKIDLFQNICTDFFVHR